MASQAKDNEEKKVQERKKALLVLICRHLCDYGYIESAERLQSEGGWLFFEWVFVNIDESVAILRSCMKHSFSRDVLLGRSLRKLFNLPLLHVLASLPNERQRCTFAFPAEYMNPSFRNRLIRTIACIRAPLQE